MSDIFGNQEKLRREGKYETCCSCGDATGRAGVGEDSLFVEGAIGPFCEECWNILEAEKRQAVQDFAKKLKEEVQTLAESYSDFYQEYRAATEKVIPIIDETLEEHEEVGK
jgi:hypothetical protein